MATYMFLDVEITDTAAQAEYRQRVGGALEGYGGRILLRGDVVHSTEGEIENRRRMILLQFETTDEARAYFELRDPSPEQREVRALRDRMGNVHSIKIVEGDPEQ